MRQTTARLPWLLIGMIGGIGNSMILGNFDNHLCCPSRNGTLYPANRWYRGNVGTQSSAIIVQGLANSSLDAKNTFKQIAKESVVALLMPLSSPYWYTSIILSGSEQRLRSLIPYPSACLQWSCSPPFSEHWSP